MPTLTNIRTEASINTKEIPRHEAEHLAHATLKAVEAYFSLPGVQADYEKWLIEYKKRKVVKV